MKNGLDNMDGSVQPPPSKRIKLEEDPNEEGNLLSRKKLGKGGQRKLPKSTLEERALVLLNDDRISAVEPQQVLCRMCGHWVKLFKHTDFSPANWRTHADKCEPRTGWKAHVRAEPGAAFTLTIPSLKPARPVPPVASVSASPVPIPPPASAAPPKLTKAHYSTSISKAHLKELLHPGAPPAPRRPIKSTAERQRALEKDTRCEVPGPHVVLCKMCGQWVKLHNTREYDLWNWHRHAEKCEVKNGWEPSGSETPVASTSGSEMAGMEVDHSTASPPVVEQPQARSALRPARKVTSRTDGQSVNADPSAERSPASTEQPEPFAGGLPSSNVNRPHNPHVLFQRKKRMPGFLLDSVMRANGPAPASDGQTSKLPVDPSSSTDHSEELRSPREIRTTEKQNEQRDVVMEESRVETDAVDNSLLDSGMPQSASKPATPFVKPEPENLDELLYPAPEPEVKGDGESASVATSAKRKKGRTAEERRQALLDDPRIGQVLPNEVYCTMCAKWIKLYKEVEYVESNWMRHAERCSVRSAAKNRPIAPRGPIPTPLATISSAAAGPLAKRPQVKSVEKRLQDLRADSRIAAIEPHQVLCGICKQWIKLQSYRDYDVWNWRKHVPLCEQRHAGASEGSSGQQPALNPQPTLRLQPALPPPIVKAEETEAGPSLVPVVAAHLTAPPKFSSSVKVKDESTVEERREELERDDRCENIEPQRVTCKLCNRVIGLHVKKDYSLSNWHRHIVSCAKRMSKPARLPLRTPLTALGISRPAAVSTDVSSSARTAPAPDPPVPTPADEPLLTSDAEVQHIASAPAQIGRTAKSTPEDRKAKLLADPRVGVLEPNRIQCKLCQHWLKLNEFMEYAPYNWYKHIERCEVRTSLKDQGTSDAPIIVKEEETRTPEVQILDEASISANCGTRKRSTAAERLARLQADSRIKTIEKHRTRCGLCDKWVKLQNKTEYDPHNWFAHVKKCMIRSKAPVQPQTSNVHTFETRERSPTVNGDSDSASCFIGRVGNIDAVDRRALLLNDSRSAAVEPHRVLCAICQQWIKLRDGKEYVPYNWFKHKSKCERRNGLPRTQIPFNEDGVSAPAFVKEVVKKEPMSIDLGLYNNDPRKMTDEEREAQLRADPRLGDVEPGRVFCKMCDSWIKLNMSTGFLRGNWMRHAQRCKGKTSWQGVSPATHEEPPELSAVEIIDLESDGPGDGLFGSIELGRLIGTFEPTISSIDYGKPPETKAAPAVVKQAPTWNMPTLRARTNTPTVNNSAPLSYGHSEAKVSDAGKRMHRSEESRKEELENDPRAKIVHPDKIFCAMCNRWIQMRRDVSYSPQNWLKHAGICEQRTGWLQNHNTGSDDKPTQPISRSASEEIIPYNARVHVDEQPDFDVPSLKPVNWEQIVYSDDDDNDDEDVDADDILVPSLPPDTAAPSVSKPLPVSAHGQVPSVSTVTSKSSTTTGVPSFGNASKISVPTPLSSLRVTKVDTKAVPISAPSSSGMRKPASNSPPMLAPFTTVPLPFYRAAFSPQMVQSGFTTNKDGAPPKSGSPQNASAQRPMPFVVPASSMLPHLLPRPVLVPISHASRSGRRSAIPSPFLLPATPPLPPPVGSGKPNGALPTPPATAATGNDAVGAPPAVSPISARASPPQTNGVISSEPTGVAVPTPIRSILGHSTITADPVVDKSSTSPVNPVRPPRKSNYGPVGPGVLQLAPRPATQIPPSTGATAEPERDVTMSEERRDVPDVDVRMTAEPAQDAMLVEA